MPVFRPLPHVILGLVLVCSGLSGCATTVSKPVPAATGIRLPALFSDNMVLQRDRPIPIWGKANPGGRVQVAMNGRTAAAVADASGAWRVNLPRMAAGGPYTLTVSGETDTMFFNVLVGDVWLCSGQSNMAMAMNPGPDAVYHVEQELAAADHPNIRLLNVPAVDSFAPQDDIPGVAWQPCGPKTVIPFSAVGYFFGRDLHEHLGVPIGLINASRGASPAEAWTSAGALQTLPEYRDVIASFEASVQRDTEQAKGYQDALRAWQDTLESRDEGHAQGRPIWAAADLDDAAWATMNLPGYWESAGLPDFDGFMWFRKTVDVPAGWAGKALTLGLTGINDMDRTWFNGTEVGRFEQASGWTRPRQYDVPADLVKPGRNVIAVRVYDVGGKGGFTGLASDLWLKPAGGAAGESLPLNGAWRRKPGLDLRTMPAKPVAPEYVPGNQRVPTVLFNAAIAPLIPYGIRGAIWYQGEGNVGRAPEYARLFPAMIRDWRARWNQGDFPFLFVQLASFMKRESEPADSAIAELREAQSRTLAVPSTGMALAIDIGDADNIHPRNKQEVGRRLALAARRVAYHESVPCEGPTYAGMKVEGNSIRIRFDHTDGGLVFYNGRAKGFAVAGADGRFAWADARVDGDTVLVHSPRVPAPVAVRYGWANNPDCTLYNGAGLPAVPFRTDGASH